MPADLREIYDAHAQALFALLLSVTRSEAETRDVLQEVFLRLAERPQALAGALSPRAVLVRMAHRLAVDAWRRRSVRARREEASAEEPARLFAPAGDPDRQCFADELERALATLPAEQRSVVHLKLWEGLTFAEIAEALEIGANTAASRYRYGIDKLQERLRPLYQEL